MKTFALPAAAAAAFLVVPLAPFLGSPARPSPLAEPLAASAAETWGVDPVHSSVNFGVRHMGISTTHGRFNEFSGTIQFDAADPTKCTVSFEIQADSIDTNNEDRDKHLASPDFFNAKQFPTVTFASKSVKAGKKGVLMVSGELALLGVKRTVDVAITHSGPVTGHGDKELLGFEGSFPIKRSDFGMSYGLPDALGDEVTVVLSIEASKR